MCTLINYYVYIDKLLDDNVDECNITYHGTIKMEPVDVKSGTMSIVISSTMSISIQKVPKFKVGDRVRM